MRYASNLCPAFVIVVIANNEPNGTRTFYTMTGYVVSNTKVQGAGL